jgi:hypothetical protein
MVGSRANTTNDDEEAMKDNSSGSNRTETLLTYFFYALLTLQVSSFYVMSTRQFLNYSTYLSGQERNPFQRRILPTLILRPLLHTHFIVAAFGRLKGVFMPVERGASFTLSLIAISLAGFFTLKLYDAVSPYRTLRFLVYPMFLYVTLWSYVLLVQMNFFYPYDILSLAFFTAGVYFIYTNQFWPLFGVMLIGTFNRETTMFLIPIYLIDALMRASGEGEAIPLKKRLLQVPWVRVVTLSVIWVAVKLVLQHAFALNDSTEDNLHVYDNAHFLLPKHWPSILNICGYLLPVVMIFQHKLTPRRYASYLLVFPLWFVVMFFKAILQETRVYGELSGYTAVAVILLLEQYVATLRRTPYDAQKVEAGA